MSRYHSDKTGFPMLTGQAPSKFKHATFDDFARSVMPDVQWLDDFLRLRRFEKQIASSATPAEPAPEA
ncbi:hypothetical protein [Bradyrhizobium retamae]|uniref:hypothetical protein n=1 Tax=Bradyrhizobium retamae TaxID=1300035 RepID=UPI000AB009D6|nr:hypothetical protein [Bradyrhizobium retamae]